MSNANELHQQPDIIQQAPLDQQNENNVPLDYVLFWRALENVKQNWVFYLILFNIITIWYIVYVLFYKITLNKSLDLMLMMRYLTAPFFNILMLNLIYISYFSNIYKISLSNFGVIKYLEGIKKTKKVLLGVLIIIGILYIGRYLVFSVLLGKLFFEATSSPINPASAYVVGLGPYFILYSLWGLITKLSWIVSVPLVIYTKKHHVKRSFKIIAFAIIYFFCIQASFSLFFSLSRIKI
jgi:hypothetical protein